MHKKAKGAGLAEPAAVLEPPAPAQPARPYVVNFRHVDTAGRPRAHAWLPWTVVVEGCASAEDAKAKLLELVAAAVFQVEPARQ